MARKWKITFAVIVVLMLIGLVRACSSEDTELGPAQDDSEAAEWVGTVTRTDVTPYSGPTVEIDFGSTPKSIGLAHLVTPTDCTDDNEAAAAALRTRLAELLPAGTAVRVVRQTSGSSDVLSYSGGYIYAATPLVATTTLTATTTSTTATPTAPTTESAAPTTTTASTTTTATPTETRGAPAPASAAPGSAAPGSANEVLLAEGYAAIDDPDLDFSIAATEPLDEQIAYATRSAGVDGPMVTRLISASQIAWDTSAGTQAACRIADQPRVDEKLRRDEEERLRRERTEASLAQIREQQAKREIIRAGADGQLGTADDDNRTYLTDDNGDLYIPSQTSSSGGGFGGGGGGFRCRSRWC